METANKPHVIIIHGTGGSPESNWIPWLKSELEKRGVKTSTPAFPTPHGQNLANWLNSFSNAIGEVTPNMILVGHSIGAAMALRLVERAHSPVRGTFLVAGWEGLLGSQDFDPLIHSFFDTPLDLTKIKRNFGSCKAYHGDDDPYVPLTLGEKLAEDLGLELVVIKKGGHLNSETGLVKFPLLLEDILAVLSSGS